MRDREDARTEKWFNKCPGKQCNILGNVQGTGYGQAMSKQLGKARAGRGNSV